MTLCLPVADVVETNRKLTLDNHVLLDVGKLEGALGRPMHTFDGQALHPTLFERAGALLDGLVAAHAFQDGNKRTAWISANIYLDAFGAVLGAIDPFEAADFVEDIALRKYSVKEISFWLVDRIA